MHSIAACQALASPRRTSAMQTEQRNSAAALPSSHPTHPNSTTDRMMSSQSLITPARFIVSAELRPMSIKTAMLSAAGAVVWGQVGSVHRGLFGLRLFGSRCGWMGMEAAMRGEGQWMARGGSIVQAGGRPRHGAGQQQAHKRKGAQSICTRINLPCPPSQSSYGAGQQQARPQHQMVVLPHLRQLSLTLTLTLILTLTQTHQRQTWRWPAAGPAAAPGSRRSASVAAPGRQRERTGKRSTRG